MRLIMDPTERHFACDSFVSRWSSSRSLFELMPLKIVMAVFCLETKESVDVCIGCVQRKPKWTH
jgi:hypothetical protein